MFSITWKVRPAEDADAVDEDDTVELEKSNILVMGPTGSGNFMSSFFIFIFFLSGFSVVNFWLDFNYNSLF